MLFIHENKAYSALFLELREIKISCPALLNCSPLNHFFFLYFRNNSFRDERYFLCANLAVEFSALLPSNASVAERGSAHYARTLYNPSVFLAEHIHLGFRALKLKYSFFGFFSAADSSLILLSCFFFSISPTTFAHSEQYLFLPSLLITHFLQMPLPHHWQLDSISLPCKLHIILQDYGRMIYKSYGKVYIPYFNRNYL